MEYYAPSRENRGVCFPAMKAPCGALFKKGTFSSLFYGTAAWRVCMRSPVDREYPVPLYWQVAEAIKRQIADGVLRPGDKLPTEKWLTETYNVSRVTARKAVQTLISNGTLERVRGESPTIAYPHMSRQTNHLSGLSEDLKKMGYVPGALILLCMRETATPYVAAKLDIKLDAPVFRLRRLRTADNMPLAIHDCWYPLEYCSDFLTETYHADSVYELLEENGFGLVRATQTVSAKNATHKEAELLGIQDGSALLHVERVSYTATNIAMEFSDMLYNPVRYDLHMELNR